MSIYTLFIQHVVNSIKDGGKGAIIVPTGVLTAKSGVEKKILTKLIHDKIISGVISMPSNVFANTGTNVSVLFFDKSIKTDDYKVVLVDASKMGEDYQDGNNKKKRLKQDEIDEIVRVFKNKEVVDDLSVAVSYEEIKEKKYSLAAGQYFEVKIVYVELTQEEFQDKMNLLNSLIKEISYKRT